MQLNAFRTSLAYINWAIYRNYDLAWYRGFLVLDNITVYAYVGGKQMHTLHGMRRRYQQVKNCILAIVDYSNIM